jgi:hypothetical protein
VSLEVDPSSWDGLLERLGCADAYYLRPFVESAALLDGARTTYLHLAGEGGDVVFPCLLREIDGGGCDAATPIGYGGPLRAGLSPPVDRFYELYEDWCAESGVVTTFARFHPLFENYRYAGPSFRREPVEGSVAWPLTGDLLEGMHRHHRRLVRKAERTDVDVVVQESPSDLDGFAGLYDETMRRAGAQDYYFFPEAYWKALAGLGDRLVLLEARAGGALIAGVLCLATAPWLHYHLGASSDEGRRTGASHLLMYAAAKLGQEHGFELFHLGSGIGGGGGALLEFKQRFAPGPLREQWFGKAVHDVPRYLELTGTDTVGYEGFFPAYRRPPG